MTEAELAVATKKDTSYQLACFVGGDGTEMKHLTPEEYQQLRCFLAGLRTRSSITEKVALSLLPDDAVRQAEIAGDEARARFLASRRGEEEPETPQTPKSDAEQLAEIKQNRAYLDAALDKQVAEIEARLAA